MRTKEELEVELKVIEHLLEQYKDKEDAHIERAILGAQLKQINWILKLD